ncbi:histidine kinase transcriptional regulator protein [Nonlabens dokdonensis]|uniref:Histidine kinase transcriptional regulator protein n=2 Tax=Nonlabens dokdonensis TaxID=328515 RepID=A0A1Z8B6B7_9FLAO|nr:histidine kinase transcriptional regulator protein [Nonlabens dokdonensis]
MTNYNYFIGIFIFMLVITIGIISLFLTFNKRKNQLLQEKLEERLAAQKRQHKSELNALRSQLNPHFVHNSLNAIQYYIQRNEVEISEHYLTKFSKLMRLFFDYSRKKQITLEEEISFLNKYLEIEKMRFEEKLNYKITIDPELDTDNTVIPTMLLQPMVENSVNHGIFHKPEPGFIEISFEKDSTKNGYNLHIIDDGIGLKKSKELHAQHKTTTKAHSSEVIKERISILNDSKEWHISYDIVDRSQKSSTTGTAICMTFKNLAEQ